MSPYVCDCTNVVYMFCVYCIYYYVNKFEARSLFSTSHIYETFYMISCFYKVLDTQELYILNQKLLKVLIDRVINEEFV